MLIKLIIFGLVIYFVSKLFFKPVGKSNTDIKGKAKSKPLDTDNNEIQDIDFKELDD